MDLVFLETGEELIAPCEKYSGFYIVLDGGIIENDELLVRGESFGLKALYKDHYSGAVKKAVKKTQLICLDRKRFLVFSKRFPHTACKIHINIVNNFL